MWFWINFSPIGQAPPSPKKPNDAPNDKKGTVEPEAKLEGLFRKIFPSKFLSESEI